MTADRLSIASEVRCLLGEEAVARLRSHPRTPDVCLVCDGPIGPDDRAELVVLRFDQGDRAFAQMVLAHPACQPSAVLEGGHPGLGREASAALVAPAVRRRPPRAVVIVDLMTDLLEQVSPAGELADVRLQHLLGAGFVLLTSPDIDDLDVPSAERFSARWSGTRLTVIGPDDFVCFDGDCRGPAHWQRELKVARSVVAVIGSQIGLDAEDPPAVFATAVREARVVAGTLPVSPGRD